MRPGEIVSIAFFFGAIAGLTAISSKKIGEADREAALAAAIKAEFHWVPGFSVYSKDHDPSTIDTLCLESREAYDLKSLSGHLSDTILRPVPVSLCRREIEEGDFGMFTAVFHHFGPRDESAAHLKVAQIECQTSSSCTIDIDGFGGGNRHFIERKGQDWQVVKSQMLWVV
ncbi:hypothetical protein Q9K01_08065 [Qipengyuania sp. DY56-A-20]|jgi:hypothetical protein|uniref:SnoaL-like domain-containing protein n=1 Tax=Qipengyuania benthica TaxID=3067651 RepID=A0ABT9H8K0_9SPHN|nr:hypothetical protein [Qipengyuania sp. DY56-A-20]MDP4539573.1 hypothetical protein [Qipengyuania sp. DY56-A-20]